MGHSARRRNDLKRMKARARKIMWWRDNPEYAANYMAVCSCEACGNPRKYTGEITLQEQRENDRGIPNGAMASTSD